jgi:hypothetical protein
LFVCLGFLTGAGFFCNDFGDDLNIEVDLMSKEISLSAASASMLLDRQEMPPANKEKKRFDLIVPLQGGLLVTHFGFVDVRK